jgi:hypothetical protein
MVRLARETERPVQQRYDFNFTTFHPRSLVLSRNDEGGELCVFDDVDPRYHYVIGADCQWGVTDRSDFDTLFVQCLETDKVVARCMGRYDPARWAMIIAGMGWYYNTACVAPERNAKAANAVLPVMRGISSAWEYPNIYVRRDRMGMKVTTGKGWGWHTDEHTKGELISYAKTETLGSDPDDPHGPKVSYFDWCDEETIDQMMAYIWDKNNKMTAPTGAHDDLLMARLITGYVSRIKKPETDLFQEREQKTRTFAYTSSSERLRWMMDRNEEDYGEDYDELDEYE